MKNNKGPIAQTYVELQGLPALERASKCYVAGKHSQWNLIKIILQASEIGIQNLNNLTERCIQNLNENKLKSAFTKLGWIKDINNLLIQITNLQNSGIHEIFIDSSEFVPESQEKLLHLYKKFDDSIKAYLQRNSISLTQTLEDKMPGDVIYKFFHDYRIISYEITLWNKNLANYSIPTDTDYSHFIGLHDITAAVNEPHLSGDTFFQQFRCLHQIPELFTTEVNNQIEFSLIALKNQELQVVYNHLRNANLLFAIPVACFTPIINNLSQNDYHQFRKHLGLTSGSHSVNLHFHLFRDLYPSITSLFVSIYFKNAKAYRDATGNDFGIKLVENELFTLRNLLHQWRNFHLHLPRLDLGGNNIKSLVGSPDAIDTVKKMQASANATDPLNKILGLYNLANQNQKSNLADYIDSEDSLDSKLGIELGKITLTRFKEVQERAGIFSQPIVFKNPPKRKV